MSSNDPHPSRIIGGGINTSDAAEPVVVTQMLGVDNSGPVKEESLRARFLSFDPLFDTESRLVAHQLVLRGPTATPDAPRELRQMDEDMLLTGLYSLAQDGLTGELPLLVRISPDAMFSDLLQQFNQDGLIWQVPIDDGEHLVRALALQEAGLTFCPILNRNDPVVYGSVSAWRYVSWRDGERPPPTRARLVVENLQHAPTRSQWPAGTWFKGGIPSGDTQPGLTHEQAMQLDLLAIAQRQSLETLIRFFRLNPDLEPRLLAIANSPAGGLSRPAESVPHALIMLGPQRASRLATLLALAGRQPTEASRHYAITALTRALFLGKVTRMGAPAANAASAFEVGLLSAASHALGLPAETLVRKLQLSPTTASALTGNPSPEGTLLQLAHACEKNDANALANYSRQLGIELHQISVAYLDALIAASALDAALH
ncbi:MAG: EAL and HDOD domain-containing protein [Gammaproteobacteria bacterium]